MVIPIVFCADNNFILPLQVALISLLENKKSDTEYDIYILHPNDLEIMKINASLLNYEKKLHFISMGDAYQSANISNPIWTSTIFYRLSIHQILPDKYRKCIYCDSDVIINCDLGKFFQEDIESYFLAGKTDPIISYIDYREDFPNPNTYINSGVLLINLEKWRNICIEKLFNKYITQNFKFPDQDILNLVCRDNIYYLEKDKFILSGVIDGKKYSKIKNAIVHYCGPVKPWDIMVEAPYFKLWLRYADRVCSGLRDKLKKRKKIVDNYLNKNNIYKVIVWGMTAATLDICYFLEELNLKVCAIGDNNEQKVKRGAENFKMIGREDISNYKTDITYIVVPRRFCSEINYQLKDLGISQERILNWENLKNVICNIN